MDSRYDTVPHAICLYSYRERHRAASAETKIELVRYDDERDVRLYRNDFFGNPYILHHPDLNRLGFAIFIRGKSYGTVRFEII